MQTVNFTSPAGVPVGAAGRTAPVGAPAPGASAPGAPAMPIGEAGRTMPLEGSVPQPVNPQQPGVPVQSGMPSYAAPGTSVTADGKTMPPKGYEAPKPSAKVDEHNPTVGVMRKELQLDRDPVVGFLVCVRGKPRGNAFELRGQVTTVGRSSRMHIRLTDDMTVSEEDHAHIIYDDRGQIFYITPLKNRNIVYVNDRAVLAPTPIVPYDMIDLGQTRLCFIPLCGERFSWTNEAV